MTTPGNHAYADINMNAPITLSGSNAYNSTVYVRPEARAQVFPAVWGPNAFSINVPWTWNYTANQLIANVVSNGPSVYDIAYSSINDPRYQGLFDLSVFSIGNNLSYLYAVPGNVAVKLGDQEVRMKYVFVLRQPTGVKLTPVFPVGAQFAADPAEVKSRKIQMQAREYTMLSTLEGGEPNKPGSGGGSIWWNMTAPFAGFLRLHLDPVYDGWSWSAIPLVYVWSGDTLSTLTPLGSNYVSASSLNNELIIAVETGQQLWISADRQGAGSIFTLTATMEPLPINTDPDHATSLVGRHFAFENGDDWVYTSTFTIYPLSALYTNNDLWFKLTAPADARLSADTNGSLLTLFNALKQDLHIEPPSQSYIGSLTLFLATDDPAAIYYTVDGSSPTTNSTPYTGPFTITNSVTVNAMAWRANRSSVYDTESYVHFNGIAATPSTGSLTNNNGPLQLTLRNQDGDGSILYRLSGGDWQAYTGGLSLDGMPNGEGYLYYTTVRNGVTNPIQSAFISFKATAPTVSPPGGIISDQVSVSATPSRNGDTVWYAIGDILGGEAGSPDTLYTNNIIVPFGSRDLKFTERRDGYLDSDIIDVRYTVPLLTPRATGLVTNGLQVIHVDPAIRAGTVLMVQPDGTTASEWAAQPFDFQINELGSYQIYQTNAGWLPSGTNIVVCTQAWVNISYAFPNGLTFPQFGPYAPVTGYDPTPKLTVTKWPASASVFYTLDGTTPSAANGTAYATPFTLPGTNGTDNITAAGYINGGLVQQTNLYITHLPAPQFQPATSGEPANPLHLRFDDAFLPAGAIVALKMIAPNGQVSYQLVDDPSAVAIARSALDRINNLSATLLQGAITGSLSAQQQQDGQTYLNCYRTQGAYTTRAVPATASLTDTRLVEWLDGQSVQAGVWRLSLVTIPSASWEGWVSFCPIPDWGYDRYQVARDFERDTGAVGFASQSDPNAIVGLGYSISAFGAYGESASVYVNVSPNGPSGTIVNP